MDLAIRGLFCLVLVIASQKKRNIPTLNNEGNRIICEHRCFYVVKIFIRIPLVKGKIPLP